MSAVGSAAKWGARAIALKIFGPALASIGAIGAVTLLVLGIVLLGDDGGSTTNRDCVAVTTAGGGQPVAKGKIPNPEWEKAVIEASKTSGIPSSVLAAQIETESQWNPNAKSPAGAEGLTQFIPSTWAKYGNGKPQTDPLAAIDAQGRYMKDLKQEMQDLARESQISDVDLALAAYNAGSGAVFNAGGIPPFEETQNYVAKINELKKSYEAGGLEGDEDSGTKNVVAVRPAAEVAPTVQTVAETTKHQSHIVSGEKLQKDAYQLARAVQDQFPELETIGGWRPTDAISQDHPEGRAVDIMIPDYASEDGKKLGAEINAYVWANATRYHVEYSIWRQDLYNEAGGGAEKPYRHMEDRGSDTQNHFDHVHVTVAGGGPNDGTAGEIPKRDGAGVKTVANDPGSDGQQCEQGGAGTQNVSYSGGQTTGNDDYPFKDRGGGVNEQSQFYFRQCTDFAWWRLNQQLGGDANNIKVTNTSFQPKLGNGGEWDAGWRAKGWPVDNTPEVGAMAVFKPGVSGADPTYGHIAVVKEVHGDKVVIEEYNALVPLGYGTRELPANGVSYYLHIPDSEKKASPGKSKDV